MEIQTIVPQKLCVRFKCKCVKETKYEIGYYAWIKYARLRETDLNTKRLLVMPNVILLTQREGAAPPEGSPPPKKTPKSSKSPPWTFGLVHVLLESSW